MFPWERRRRYLAGVAVVAAMTVAYALAERAGIGRALDLWVPVGFVLLTVLLVALWVLLQVARLWFAPGQRIARCLRDGKAEEAVRVGEAVPLDRRDAQTEWNLAVAYEAAGRMQDAEALWTRLGERTDLAEQMVTALRQRANQVEEPAPQLPGGPQRSERGSTNDESA